MAKLMAIAKMVEGIYFMVKIQNPAKRRLLAVFMVEKRFAEKF